MERMNDAQRMSEDEINAIRDRIARQQHKKNWTKEQKREREKNQIPDGQEEGERERKRECHSDSAQFHVFQHYSTSDSLSIQIWTQMIPLSLSLLGP